MAPAEVEAVLAGQDGVLEVAVVGLPDPAWGEIVCAVVVIEPGRPAPSLGDLRARCAGHLAAFKHPRVVHVVEALPRTATGQIQRRQLVEALQAG